VKKAAVLALVGQLVEIDHGPHRPRALAIVLGYGYRQRHGRGSPVEEDWTSRSGGSSVAIALRHDDGTWTPEAVHLITIHPHEEHHDTSTDITLVPAHRAWHLTRRRHRGA
jgi:hypothetical protein